MIPLEDDPCDVIGKAMRGEGMDVSQLASAAQLEASLVQDVLDGNLNADAVKRIAAVLNLGAEALMSLPSYAPEVALPDGLHCITTPFGHAGVNAFVLVHGSSACVFDTGTDAQPISSFLSSNNLHLDTLFITHRHPDH
ncbi:MAG: MBL fold metallo-hydrolase, partial [Akkermansiaceae bacterium]